MLSTSGSASHVLTLMVFVIITCIRNVLVSVSFQPPVILFIPDKRVEVDPLQQLSSLLTDYRPEAVVQVASFAISESASLPSCNKIPMIELPAAFVITYQSSFGAAADKATLVICVLPYDLRMTPLLDLLPAGRTSR